MSIAEYKCQCGHRRAMPFRGETELSIECERCNQMMLRVEEHTESKDCWCEPKVMQQCPDCDGGIDPNVVCKRCECAGMVDQYDESLPFTLIHNETDSGTIDIPEGTTKTKMSLFGLGGPVRKLVEEELHIVFEWASKQVEWECQIVMDHEKHGNTVMVRIKRDDEHWHPVGDVMISRLLLIEGFERMQAGSNG